MNFHFTNWVRCTTPELVWIGVIHEVLGIKPGVAAALALAQTAQLEYGDAGGLPPFCFARAFSGLSEQQTQNIIRRLDTSPDGEAARTALTQLHLIYPDYPLVRLARPTTGANGIEAAIKLLDHIVAELSDRRSKPAALVQGTALYIAVVTGRLFFSKDAPPPDLEALVDYPTSEASKMAAAEVRAGINGLIGLVEPADASLPKDGWPASFWENGLSIGNCR